MRLGGAWIVADELISPLGLTSEENFEAVKSGSSGLTASEPLGKIKASFPSTSGYSAFENLAIQSIAGALRKAHLDSSASRVLFVLSSTKGNIGFMEEGLATHERIHLPATARFIARHFGNSNEPVVVSNACTSGVASILLAKRMVEVNRYDHVIVVGVDVLSKFVVSGFQCLHALSTEACRPFDQSRKGTSLGEAAATVIVTGKPESLNGSYQVLIAGGAMTNDANHISGPSRTGEELGTAVLRALAEAGLDGSELDFISAHGTATIYNDEMEAKALHFAGLSDIPLNSLKGNFGHTLGAAGVVESIMSIHSMRQGLLLPSWGFERSGVSVPVNVIRETQKKSLQNCLKTASGFGGCNAAMVLRNN